MRTEKRNPYDPPKRIGVGRIIFYVIAVLILILLMLVLAQVVMTRKNGEPPRVFGYGIFLMTNDSMGETIREGEALLVQQLDGDDYRIGDVITYKEGVDAAGKIVIDSHRIVDVQWIDGERAFLTRADTESEGADAKIRMEADVYGKVVRVMPWLGSFFTYLRTPFGLVTCVAVPLGVLLILEILNLTVFSRSRYEEEEEDETEEDGEEPRKKRRKGRNEEPSGEESPSTREWRPIGKPAHPLDETPKDSIIDTRRYTVTQETVPLESPSAARPKTPFPPSPIHAAGRTAVLSQTREFALSPSEKKPARPPVVHPEIPPLEEPAPARQSAAPLTDTALVNEALSRQASPQPEPVPPPRPVSPGPAEGKADFLAQMASEGKDRFQIDGIDVQVRPDALKLVLPEKQKERDVSITVTEEYTNVTIGTQENEINFALFRDGEDGERKVIIRRKNR